MIRHLAAFLTSVLLVLATIVGTGSSAQATPTAATYYADSFAFKACAIGTTTCTVAFSQMPNKYILFTSLSCYVSSSNPLSSITFGVKSTPGGETLRKTHIQIPALVLSSSENTYSINQPISILFGPGRYPVISMSMTASGSNSLECTITGEAVAGP